MRMVLFSLVLSSFSYSVHAENLGQWSKTTSLPNIPISIAVLPNNKVLTWSADDQYTFSGTVGTTPTPTLNSLYAISSGAIVAAQDTGMMADMFCSGIALLPDGRVLVNGGSSDSHTGIYDFSTNSWRNDASMNISRGYNSSVTLSTGNVFTIGGSWAGNGAPKDGRCCPDGT